MNEVEPPSSPSRNNVGNHQPTNGRGQGSSLEIKNRHNVYSLKVSVHLRYAIQNMPKFIQNINYSNQLQGRIPNWFSTNHRGMTIIGHLRVIIERSGEPRDFPGGASVKG